MMCDSGILIGIYTLLDIHTLGYTHWNPRWCYEACELCSDSPSLSDQWEKTEHLWRRTSELKVVLCKNYNKATHTHKQNKETSEAISSKPFD